MDRAGLSCYITALIYLLGGVSVAESNEAPQAPILDKLNLGTPRLVVDIIHQDFSQL